jgi:Zn-dependent M28 family amino/carboxypeptidase
LTAHYDHVGKRGDKIFNGADDNASGTSALMEIAKVCMSAKKAGQQFSDHIMFVAFSAEEKGLIGAEHFISSKMADSMQIKLNINMDMIGKSIKYGLIETFKESANPNFKEDTTLKEDYVYLFKKGQKTGKYSKYSKKAGKMRKFQVDRSPGLLLRLLYKGSSDHKPFLDAGIPVMVYFTGLHPDYHTERDTADKLDYENLTIITKIIFETVFQITTKS